MLRNVNVQVKKKGCFNFMCWLMLEFAVGLERGDVVPDLGTG